MRKLRLTLLTLLVLVVPTFALGGEEEPSGPATLSVSASLEQCGVANAQVVCQIATSWSSLEGADYYTVSVTRPDGSVVDLGQTDGTTRSIFVPYVGPGSYSVQVAAWGTPPGAEEAEVLGRAKAVPRDGRDGDPAIPTSADGAQPEGDIRGAADAAVGGDQPAPVAEPPVEPECEEPVDEDAGTGGQDGDADGEAIDEAADGAKTAAAEADALEDEAEQPVCP